MCSNYLSQVENGLKKLREKEVVFSWGDKDIAFQKKELERFYKYVNTAEVFHLKMQVILSKKIL